jgi:hypothetical protein
MCRTYFYNQAYLSHGGLMVDCYFNFYYALLNSTPVEISLA